MAAEYSRAALLEDASRPGEISGEIADSLLVRNAREDRRAFAALYHRYATPVYHYCYRRLGTRELAEDATSQTFLKALAALDQCRDEQFRPWLFTIAHNVVVDRIRRDRTSQPIDTLIDLESADAGPENQALAADERLRLERAVRSLPADQRAVIELRLAGLTGAETAGVLGRNAAATRQLQFRAISNLRALLADGPAARGT